MRTQGKITIDLSYFLELKEFHDKMIAENTVYVRHAYAGNSINSFTTKDDAILRLKVMNDTLSKKNEELLLTFNTEKEKLTKSINNFNTMTVWQFIKYRLFK